MDTLDAQFYARYYARLDIDMLCRELEEQDAEDSDPCELQLSNFEPGRNSWHVISLKSARRINKHNALTFARFQGILSRPTKLGVSASDHDKAVSLCEILGGRYARMTPESMLLNGLSQRERARKIHDCAAGFGMTYRQIMRSYRDPEWRDVFNNALVQHERAGLAQDLIDSLISAIETNPQYAAELSKNRS